MARQPYHRKVLFVDDDRAMRAVVRWALSADFELLEADSGRAALALLAAEVEPLGLLLADVVMPGMSGVALAQKVRETWPELPVIYMSGYSVDELHDQGVVLADALLQKPIAARALREAIWLALDGRVP